MNRDVTDTLIKAMESSDGALQCIVVMLNDRGEIMWISSTDSLSAKLGMIETMKLYMIADMQKEEET